MRDLSNCLNALLVLLTLPLYLLAPIAALAGIVIGQLAPTWLPDWLQFITTRTFLFAALGMFVWYLFVNTSASGRRGNTMDFDGIESAFAILEDGISGYLLLLGVLVAFVVFKGVRRCSAEEEMRDNLKYFNDILALLTTILALLTLPIYLLAPLAAFVGRAIESWVPGLLPS